MNLQFRLPTAIHVLLAALAVAVAALIDLKIQLWCHGYTLLLFILNFVIKIPKYQFKDCNIETERFKTNKNYDQTKITMERTFFF